LTIEIARQLRQQNHQVGLVALLDGERPGFRPPVRGKRLALLAARVRFHWRRLRGLSIPEKLVYVGDFLRHVAVTVVESLFVRHRPWVLRLQRVFGPLLPQSVFDNAWSRTGALQNFSAANYPDKVILFRATDVPVHSGGDETLGWNSIVDGGVEVIYVPGDHETMFLKPNVQFLSQRFRQAMQLAES
jgi:thioesterase domain-containing protein